MAFGVGFGAAEAALLALDPLLSPLEALEPGAGAGAAAARAGPANVGEILTAVFAPVVERLNTIPVHALPTALAAYAVRTRTARPIVVAFAYKTLVDALPVELLQPWGIWAMVAAYLPFGVVGVLGLGALRRRWVGGRRATR